MGNTKQEPWVMPAWMEPYRHLIVGNGEPVETLMNTSGKTANIFNNAPLALICVDVKAQVGLLEKLHARGLLKGWAT